MSRIRFLSQYFLPEPGATSELLSGVAVRLARDGHTVDAIAGQPTYHGDAPLSELVRQDGVLVRRVWSTRLDRQRPLGRVVNTATFAFSALLGALRTPRATLLIAVTNPPPLLWVCRFARLVRGLRYVLVIHDVYPEVAVRLGALGRRSPVTWLWRQLNRLTCRGAERIVVLGRDMRRVLAAELPAHLHERIVLIANWADGRAVRPRPREGHELIDSVGGRDRLVVQYSGNIGRFHEIDTILAAADRLREDPFLFVFIGQGAQHGLVERRTRAPGGGNVRLLPFQPRERLGTTLTGCDVGLVTLRAGLSGLCVPSKLYGIMAAGRPVLAVVPDDSEAAAVVQETGCGVVVSPGDVDALVAALWRLQREPDLRARMGRAARAAFERDYDLDQIAQKWQALLAGLSRRR